MKFTQAAVRMGKGNILEIVCLNENAFGWHRLELRAEAGFHGSGGGAVGNEEPSAVRVRAK
jgi:hypothetical protein